MKNKQISICLIAMLTIALFCLAASGQRPVAEKPGESTAQHVRSSPAFAELMLRKTDVEADLEALLLDYKEEFPQVIELRYQMGLLNNEIERMLGTKESDSGRLTLSLGKLIVRRIELETNLWKLLQAYQDGHPDVRRAKRRVEIYSGAIKEILGN